MATVGAIYAEIRATTTGLRRDMADAVTITKQGTTAMSQVLDEFGKPVFSGITDSAKRLKGPVLDVDNSLKALARTSRGLVGPLASELGPAFDTVGIRIAQVLTTSASLGSGMGALAIAAAGLAGIIGGALLTAWKKTAEETKNFQDALNSMDLGKIQGEIDKLMVKLDEAAGKLRSFRRDAVEAPAGPFSPEFPEVTGGRVTTERLAPRTSAELDERLRQLREARERRDAVLTGKTEVEAFQAFDKMREKTAQDFIKAEEDRLKQLDDARFAAARKSGEAVLAEEISIQKESEKANQVHDAEMAKLDQERVQRNFAAGRAVNEEEERLNKESLAADIRQLDQEKALTEEGLKSQLAAIDAEQDEAIKTGKLMMDLDEAQASARKRAADEFVDSFTIGNLIIADALDDILQRTHTVGEAFAQMGRAIASALIHNVVEQGLKAVEKALFEFIAEVQALAQEKGIIQALLGAVIGVAGAGASATVAGYSPTGTLPEVEGGGFNVIGRAQHGGIFNRPTVALIGEAGPEAVIPLSHLGGGGGVEVNINVAPGLPVEQRERTGSQGKVIKDIWIGQWRTALASGALDQDFAQSYGLRRQATGR